MPPALAAAPPTKVPASTPPAPPRTLPSLEELAFLYGTDKSHDDHKYVDVYAALFDSTRLAARNVTEIGIASGQSLQMWSDYFAHADIWGVDVLWPRAEVRQVLREGHPRLHLLRADSRSEVDVRRLGLANESMDVIVDDGDHYHGAQLATLELWWRFLRPGGVYAIEDVPTGANRRQRYGGALPAPGYAFLVHNESTWPPSVRRIFDEHDAFFVDSLVGHRAYSQYARAMGRLMHRDRVDHHSHVLVLRKRTVPRRSSVRVHWGKRALGTPVGIKASGGR